jgi:hypothetical protein
MFQNDSKTPYDCPYCHNKGSDACSWGVEVGADNTRIIQLEGATITVDWGQAIQPGDTYIAQRNNGWKLLTCDYVSPAHCVFPVEKAYVYDTWESVKVISIT